MNEQNSYSNERVVGHHISARSEENKPGPLLESVNVEPRFSEYIVVKEGDVDWEIGTQQVRLTPVELKEIYEHFFGEDE